MKRFALLLLIAGCGGSSDAPASSSEADTGVASDTATAPGDTTTEPTDSAEPPADSVATEVATDTLPDDTGITFGPYPAGPYGNKVGDVVANLTWEGYVNPLADSLANTKPYVTTDMDKLRRDAKKGYALVHVSEFF